MSTKLNIPFRIIFILLLIITGNLQAENLSAVINLEGKWKFSVGDNSEWSKPDFDDGKWESIYVPSNWENQGYENYNGYAWYRKQFVINQSINSSYVFLVLGYIDDADEVYVNGKLVGGEGGMQNNPETAYNIKRKYPIPVSLLNKNGQNTIAVRVYDFYEGGGITGGEIGIFKDRHSKYLEIDLAGYWGFETETEMKKRIKYNLPKTDNKIFVPASWESQGYKDYDGKARYNVQFKVPSNLKGKELYFILGFIDDVETVYLNKTKIGSVFSIEDEEQTRLPYYIIFRAYKIPDHLLKYDSYNQLSVMVFDKGLTGGIYSGPIGITTKGKYEELKIMNTKKRGFWDTFFNIY